MSPSPSPHGSQSLWLLTEPGRRFSLLEQDITVDFCVIGGGMAGLSTAYELTPFGSVAVMEAGLIGSGMTGRTTAHISNALDDRYTSLEKVLGGEGARLAAHSHTAAIHRIGWIVEEEKIECDFARLDGFLISPRGEKEKVLEEEYAAAGRAGLTVEMITGIPQLPWHKGRALRFPDQAQFHPVKYLLGLAAAVERRGGRVFTGARAVSMKGGAPAVIHTEGGPVVTAGHLIVATNTPVNDRVVLHTKQSSYTSLVIALRRPESAGPFLLWDTCQEPGDEDRDHYVREARDARGRVLIIGGEDYKTGQEDDLEESFKSLEKWGRDRFTGLGDFVCRWSGQVFEPLDGMAFIGRNPADHENVYVATGDSGNGITHGSIAGMLIRDLIRGTANPWISLYSPGRVNLLTLPRFMSENLNTVAQMKDLVTAGGDVHECLLQPGCGPVARDGLRKVATYRDAGGTFHRFSAICPHLKCVVRWNAVENSWDCPCHGSRFDAMGEVMVGPANRSLERLEE